MTLIVLIDVLELKSGRACQRHDFYQNLKIGYVWPSFSSVGSLRNKDCSLLLYKDSTTLRERSHMTSAAEGGRGYQNADGCWQGRGGSKPCWRHQKYLDFGKNCFKSSGPITMRETTALIYTPLNWWRVDVYLYYMIAHTIYLTTFSFKLDKINIYCFISVLCRGFFETLTSLLNGGGGLANADVIRGVAQCWQLLTGGRGGGGKICQNLADVICERSL